MMEYKKNIIGSHNDVEQFLTQNISFNDVMSGFSLGDMQDKEKHDKDYFYMLLKDIGKELGIGAEAVRQIEAKALKKLKHPFRNRAITGSMPMQEAYKILKDRSFVIKIENDKLSQALTKQGKRYD